MTPRCRIWVVGLGLLCGGGCGLAEQSIHVAAYKINQRAQEHQELLRNQQWADEAWATVCAAQPDLAASADYAAGFTDGFVKYVWRGGAVTPPPMPPLKYRDICYQTPTGYRAIEAWFHGYQHGAKAAQQGGYHDLVTGPSGLPKPPAPAAPPPQLLPPIETRPAPLAPLPVLPPPRPVAAAVAEPRDPGARSDLATRWDWLDPRAAHPTWKQPEQARSVAPVHAAPAAEAAGPIRILSAPAVRLAPQTGSEYEGGPRLEVQK